MNNKQEYKGKRVRITATDNGYGIYTGQMGTCTGKILGDESEWGVEVKLEDGTIIFPNGPNNPVPQCEWVEPIQEKRYVRYQKKGSSNFEYGKEYEVEEESEDWWYGVKPDGTKYPILKENASEPYTKIENTITMNTSIQDKIAQLEAQQKEIQQSIAALKEEAEWKPKIGDWVVCIDNTTNFQCGNSNDGHAKWRNGQEGKKIEIGEVRKVYKVGADNRIELEGENRYWQASQAFRKATPEEIAEAAKPKKKIVYIGTKKLPVTISRGEIMAEGANVPIQDITGLIGIHNRVCGWAMTLETVTIGCCSGITIEQLTEIRDEYNRING